MKNTIVIGSINENLTRGLNILQVIPEPPAKELPELSSELDSQIEYIIERLIRRYGKNIYFYIKTRPEVYMHFRRVLKRRGLKILYPIFNKIGFINFSII